MLDKINNYNRFLWYVSFDQDEREFKIYTYDYNLILVQYYSDEEILSMLLSIVEEHNKSILGVNEYGNTECNQEE